MSLLNLPGMTSAGRKYSAQLEKLAGQEVAVGFFDGSGGYPDGQSVAQVASANEFGTSRAPARPFMKQMAENRGKEITEECGRMAKRLAEGGSAADELSQIGKLAEDLLKEEIRSGSFAPLAPATVARKGSSQPLIDTGRMVDSVTSKVRASTS